MRPIQTHQLFMRLIFLFLTVICFRAFSQSYVISGRITDDNKQGLPFSTVLVKGTTIGTNANADGYYTLKVNKGDCELMFPYVGYKKRTEAVSVTENKTLNVSLSPESYELKEV